MNYMNNLINMRKSKGLTQTDIANLLNTSTQYYQKYEKGKHPLPIDHLITLCNYYQVSSDKILNIEIQGVNSMDKLEKFYVEMISLIEHCKEQKFIPEYEAEYIIRNINRIKFELDKE